MSFSTGLFKIEENGVSTILRVHDSEQFDDDPKMWCDVQELNASDGYVSKKGNRITVFIRIVFDDKKALSIAREYFGVNENERVYVRPFFPEMDEDTAFNEVSKIVEQVEFLNSMLDSEAEKLVLRMKELGYCALYVIDSEIYEKYYKVYCFSMNWFYDFCNFKQFHRFDSISELIDEFKTTVDAKRKQDNT